jgi:hypothetical protein
MRLNHAQAMPVDVFTVTYRVGRARPGNIAFAVLPDQIDADSNFAAGCTMSRICKSQDPGLLQEACRHTAGAAAKSQEHRLPAPNAFGASLWSRAQDLASDTRGCTEHRQNTGWKPMLL